MHIRFADADEAFIKSTVEQGLYTSETELVRDAVRRMREEHEQHEHFKAAVMQSMKEIELDQSVTYSAELMDSIKQTAMDKAKVGKPYHSHGAIPETTKS